ncbi:MAG TPA: amidohydrolase family protein [Bacteroidales bacterium]|nr:amidohydrolase family protein [Bacteroidales bacterium]HPM18987.1 amidohydrolase family protein [Bacteroidales bacterium]HQG76306.1 amidohydrolase family protein [Bacteroidales bacterium]
MITRRKFFRNSALASAGLIAGAGSAGMACSNRDNPGSYDIMEEALKFRKINAHEHVYLGSEPSSLINAADRLGMEKLVVSLPVTVEDRVLVTPEKFRECNNLVLKAMKLFPDRIMGQFYINPYYSKESLEEIDRCVSAGMVSMKGYYQVKINDPLYYPVIEKMIDLKMIILMHTHCGIGVGGYRTKYGNIQANASTPDDFAGAAERYPEALFQYAHTGGGGDWEYACKTLRDYPNVYVDTSGSNNESGMIEYAMKHLGEDRLFFGTDGSYYQGVGSILAANINDDQRKKIFFDNYNLILKRSGNHVD